MNVLNALSCSAKGRIEYDRTWFDDGKLQSVLEECSAIPKVLPLSPHTSTPRPPKNTPNTSQLNESETVESQAEAEVSSSEDDLLSAPVTHVDKVISEMEHSLTECAQDNAEKRKWQYENHSRMLLQQAESQLMELYLRREREAQNVLREARQQEQLRNEEVEKKKLKWKEHHKQHAKHMDARLQEAHRQKREEELRQQQRDLEVQQRLTYLVQRQDEVTAQATALAHALAACKHPQHLTDGVKASASVIAEIKGKLGRVIEEANQNEADKHHMTVVDDLVANAKHVFELVSKQIAEATRKGEEESAAVERQRREQREKEVKLAQAAKFAAEAQAKLLSQDDVATMYLKSQQLLETVQKSHAPLLDASMKKYKFELQKAVNTPVNAISRVSGSHLRDKLQRLVSLLSRQAVDIGANKRVSVATHPNAYDFCRDLLAKKIVNQGNEQVSSNHESAFPIAAVVVGIWSEFPDMGELLLAHFYNRCPYLVPYYLPKKDNQSSEEYYRALGYTVDNGEVEKQDKFLKRMSGFMRLYASIIVSAPPRGSTHAHPHPIQHAWRWLVRMLNQEPRPDVTATLIYDVISVTGNALFRTYNKQFLKLLQLLYMEYLPKIKAVKGAGGPVTRLEGYLEKVIKRSNIEPPSGMLSPGFWNS